MTVERNAEISFFKNFTDRIDELHKAKNDSYMEMVTKELGLQDLIQTAANINSFLSEEMNLKEKIERLDAAYNQKKDELTKKARYALFKTDDNIAAGELLEIWKEVYNTQKKELVDKFKEEQAAIDARWHKSSIKNSGRVEKNEQEEIKDLRKKSEAMLQSFMAEIEKTKTEITSSSKVALKGHIDRLKQKGNDLKLQIETLEKLRREINETRSNLNNVNRILGKEEEKPSPDEIGDFSKGKVQDLNNYLNSLEEQVEANLKNIEEKTTQTHVLPPQTPGEVASEIEAHKKLQSTVENHTKTLQSSKDQYVVHKDRVEGKDKEVEELTKQLETTRLILESKKNTLERELKIAQQEELQKKRETIVKQFEDFKLEIKARLDEASKENKAMNNGVDFIEEKVRVFEEKIKVIKNNLEVEADDSINKNINSVRDELNEEKEKINSFWTSEVTQQEENKYSIGTLDNLNKEELEACAKRLKDFSDNVRIFYTTKISNNFHLLQTKVENLADKQTKHQKETIETLGKRCNDKQRAVEEEQLGLKKEQEVFFEERQQITGLKKDLTDNIFEQRKKAENVIEGINEIKILGDKLIDKKYGSFFTRLLPIFKSKEEKNKQKKLDSLHAEIKEFWEVVKKIDNDSLEDLSNRCNDLRDRLAMFFDNERSEALMSLDGMAIVLDKRKEYRDKLDSKENSIKEKIQAVNEKQEGNKSTMDNLKAMRLTLGELQNPSEKKTVENPVSYVSPVGVTVA